VLRSVVAVVRLNAEANLDRDSARRLFLGRSAQGLFLETLAKLDQPLATALHNGNGPRPYTVGVQLQPGAAEGEGWQARLRYTVYGGALSELLPNLLDNLPETVRLDALTGNVEAVIREPGQDRDVGCTSYQELLNRRLLDAAPPDSRFGFRFLTPATFHSNDRNQPLPLPGLVFGSLVERWNAFSPLTLNAEARRYAEECLAINQFRIESHLVEVAGGRQIGATGTVGYRSLRPDPYWLRVLGVLADFAFYAGIGAKTAMGLGQARRIGEHGDTLRRGTGSDPPEDRRAAGRHERERDDRERADGQG
jgi:CRISPR-associated endoribonuclease Cas6